MKWLIIIIAWFVVSVLLGIVTGKFIKGGMPDINDVGGE